MNVIEAMKSRKPFRRKSFSDPTYYMQPIDGDLNDDYFKGVFYNLSVADIVADDWEIKEPLIPISRQQFWDAVNSARQRPFSMNDDEALDILAYRVAKILGFD